MASPRAVDARAERGVDHELHAAAFVEEALRHDFGHRGHCAQRGATRLNVFHGLFGAAAIEPALPLQELGRVWQSVHIATHTGDLP